MSKKSPLSPHEDRLSGLDPTDLLRMGIAQADNESGSENRWTPFAPEELTQQFPELEVIELLDSGGMGCVYRARQLRLGREVALKVLPKELGGDLAFAERFAREARALARLSHAHIVTIHDFGQQGDLCYIVMEFLDGMNLREWLQTGGPSVDEALNIARELCRALEYAHGEGVVHRDLKPENILFDRRGHVKLADFGLAKLAAGPQREISLTATGQALGSPHYMSPEQWERPDQVDHRTDIYALGAVLYEMLTGQRPLGRFDPPSRQPGVPAAVDEVIHTALQRDPEHRFADATQMRRALDNATMASAETDFVDKISSVLSGVPMLSLLGALVILLVGTAPWVEYAFRAPANDTTFTNTGDGYSTYLQLAGVQVENFWPLIASVVVGLLCLVRRTAPVPVDLTVTVVAVLGCIHGLLCLVYGVQPNEIHVGEVVQSRTTIAPLVMAGVYAGLLIGSVSKLWYAVYLQMDGPDRGVQSVLRTVFRRFDEGPF